MVMAIRLLYSTSGIISPKKFLATSKWQPFCKCQNIKTVDRPKVFIMVMTSSVTSHRDLKFALNTQV